MKKKFSFQHVVYILLAVAFAYAVYSYRDQLAETADVLQRGVWYLILGALLVLAGVVYNQGALYASLYRIFDLPPQKRHLLGLYLVARFIMVAAPSGGLSGWVPFIRDARQRDLGVGTVMIANLIYMILWYSVFSVFLLLGLVHLFVVHDLQWFEVSAAIMLITVDLVMIGVLVMSGVAPNMLRQVMGVVQRVTENVFGWLKRPAPLKMKNINGFVDDLNNAVQDIRTMGWQCLLKPALHAFINEALNLALLFTLALAFGLEMSFGVLVAAYSVSVLFYIISPTPGGLGFVEGALILVLTSLGVPKAGATVLTVAYRGITFWIPFILGFIALRWVNQAPVPE